MLIPELFGIHLISDDARKGQNWRGRKTKPFKLSKESNDILGHAPIPEPISAPAPVIEEKVEIVEIVEVIKPEGKLTKFFKRLFRVSIEFIVDISVKIYFFCGGKRKHYY